MSLTSRVFVIGMGVVLCGCSVSREQRDFRSSGPLYPIIKVGDLLAFLGGGMRSAASVGSSRRLPLCEVSISDDQRHLLEAIAVELPDSAIEVRSDLKIGQADSRPRVEDAALPLIDMVEEMCERRFRWWLSVNSSGIARAMPGDVIVLNVPDLSRGKDAQAQLFVLLHEAGHHALGHLKAIDPQPTLEQPWIARDMELAADGYAARVLLTKGGFKPHEVMYLAMSVFDASQPETATHPSGKDRISNVRGVVFNP